MACFQVCRPYDQLPSINKLAKHMLLPMPRTKAPSRRKSQKSQITIWTHLKRVRESEMNKGSQLNKESGVSNEQEVPAEQGVRGLK